MRKLACSIIGLIAAVSIVGLPFAAIILQLERIIDLMEKK